MAGSRVHHRDRGDARHQDRRARAPARRCGLGRGRSARRSTCGIGGRELPLGLVGVAMLLASGAACAAARRGPSGHCRGRPRAGPGRPLHDVGAEHRGLAGAASPTCWSCCRPATCCSGRSTRGPGNVLVLRPPSALAGARLGGAAGLRRPRRRGHDRAAARRGRDDDESDETTATPAEQQLFSHVVALTERHRRSVRLLIVPAHDVFDAIASTVVRLRSSEVYVGESASLVGRRSGTPPRRGVGAPREDRRPAGAPGHLPPQRPNGGVSHRRAPAVAHRPRSRSDSSLVARCLQGHRAARPPPRHRQSRSHPDGATTFRDRSARTRWPRSAR